MENNAFSNLIKLQDIIKKEDSISSICKIYLTFNSFKRKTANNKNNGR